MAGKEWNWESGIWHAWHAIASQKVCAEGMEGGWEGREKEGRKGGIGKGREEPLLTLDNIDF